jgi:anthranilate synthase component 2
LEKILVLDNYDSFTYNLVHMLEHILGFKVDVFRNDEITLDMVAPYKKILLSPGPGIPNEAGILLPLIKTFAATHSIFGVCLGHQAIGEAFGGKLSNLSSVYHGVATPIKMVNDIVESEFNNDWSRGFDQIQTVGRYHSWVVNLNDFPSELEVTSFDDNNMIMSLRHRHFDVQGVQFHPESVLTPNGENMIRNWLSKQKIN